MLKDNLSGRQRVLNAQTFYTYRDGNDKRCTSADVEKTLVRYFKSPVGFIISEMGGDSNRLYLVGKDGKRMNNADAAKISVPYKPLEIK